MHILHLHDWNLTPKEAIALQKQLASSLTQGPALEASAVRFIAGVDVSSTKYSPILTAGVIVWDRLEERMTDSAFIQGESPFPYIPGLLSFREIPLLAQAIGNLQTTPDVFLVDGHGRAHPRRMGIAAHLGLLIDVPTIGIAKSRLTGKEETLGPKKGDTAALIDREEIIGVIHRSKEKTKPLYVSVGNRIDLESAIEIVKLCLRGYRLPEPTRLAHNFVNDMRRGEEKKVQDEQLTMLGI